MQQLAAKGEFFLPETIGQEAEVANALKAGRQGVDEKAADELAGGEGQGLRLFLLVGLAVMVSGRARLSLTVGESGASQSATRT